MAPCKGCILLYILIISVRGNFFFSFFTNYGRSEISNIILLKKELSVGQKKKELSYRRTKFNATMALDYTSGEFNSMPRPKTEMVLIQFQYRTFLEDFKVSKAKISWSCALQAYNRLRISFNKIRGIIRDFVFENLYQPEERKETG